MLQLYKASLFIVVNMFSTSIIKSPLFDYTCRIQLYMDKRKTRKFLVRERRRSTKKTIARLGYDPERDKGKFVGGLRRRLQARTIPSRLEPPVSSTLKVGAININGLSLDSGWAMEQIILKYELKVHI